MANSNNLNPAPNEIQPPQKSSIWAKVLALKSLLVTFSIVGLLFTNVATVVNSNAHDWMYRFLWSAFSIGGELLANRAMVDSPKVKADQKLKNQTAELEAKNKNLNATIENHKKEIAAITEKEKNSAKKIQINNKSVKETASKIHVRLAAGVTRNLLYLPSKAAPYVGVSALVTFTALDIYDACQIMKDVNHLLVRLGEGEENPDLCGKKVPTAEEVKESTQKLFKKKEAG